jgi:hypothetical protein
VRHEPGASPAGLAATLLANLRAQIDSHGTVNQLKRNNGAARGVEHRHCHHCPANASGGSRRASPAAAPTAHRSGWHATQAPQFEVTCESRFAERIAQEVWQRRAGADTNQRCHRRPEAGVTNTNTDTHRNNSSRAQLLPYCTDQNVCIRDRITTDALNLQHELPVQHMCRTLAPTGAQLLSALRL